MAHNRLTFSVWKLLGIGLAALAFGAITMGLALELDDKQMMRHARVLRLLGPDGARWTLLGCGLFFAAAGLGAFRRLLGDRIAAMIRHDGIVLNGVFVSRYIPWRSLDRLYLKSVRIGSKIHHYLNAEARGARSSGVSIRLLDASEEEVAHWIEQACAARIEALAPRGPAPPQRRPGQQTRIQFGRRLA